jgi:hypothetical protein
MSLCEYPEANLPRIFESILSDRGALIAENWNGSGLFVADPSAGRIVVEMSAMAWHAAIVRIGAKAGVSRTGAGISGARAVSRTGAGISRARAAVARTGAAISRWGHVIAGTRAVIARRRPVVGRSRAVIIARPRSIIIAT